MDDVSLSVHTGEKVVVLGANGAGKSTLLHLLNGSLKPVSGELYFEEQVIDYGRKSLDRLRQVVAVVLQDPSDQLFAGTVFQDISFGPMNLGLKETEVKRRVERALESFDLKPFAELPPHQLSHGQRKRVALAGALAMDPRVLVLDEPTAGLDAEGIDCLLVQLERLHQKGITLVLTTHDLEFASLFANSVVLLHRGKVVVRGGLEQLRDRDAMKRIGVRVPSFTSFEKWVKSMNLGQLPSGATRMSSESVPLVTHGGVPLLRCTDHKEIVDASASISPLGMPPWLRPEIARCLEAVQRYPDPNYRELSTAIAKAHQCDVDSVVVGNGSSELLSWLPLATTYDTWLVPVPSFGEYRRAPSLVGRKVVSVPQRLGGQFEVDWGALETALIVPAVVILGHPNNPTGTLLDVSAFREFSTKYRESLFIVDEAFADFVDGFESLWDASLENVIVLRSLTKILAIPGLRLGYALAPKPLAARLKERLPPWSVNVLAQAVALRFFDEPDFAEEARRQIGALKGALVTEFRKLPFSLVLESAANWVLLRLPDNAISASDLASQSLERGVAIRPCTDFPELGQRWLRISVRTEVENEKILEVFRQILWKVTPRHRVQKPRAIMLQGCTSDAGKSILTTALCRCLREDGYRVAPFKSQNMSNNSGVTRDGGEMGRAQVLQALACGIEPDTRMNPVLLKPTSDLGAQVILRGHSIGYRKALEFHSTRQLCLEAALKAFDELSAEYDVIVCEGAGSSGEVNLRRGDIVNMGFVTERPMPVLLVGDIDRGGVYASFVGHLEVMSESDRQHVRGFLVNRFRGESSLLIDAHQWMERYTGRKVMGVVPYLTDLGLPDEDRLSLTSGARRWGDPNAPLQIAAVSGPHVSNFTDLDALAFEKDLCVRLVERAEELGQPDVVILLGTKNTLGDLNHFRQIGLTDAILRAHRNGSTIFGICGGLQMLGDWVLDESEVESTICRAPGLGLLPITTRFATEKTVRQVQGRHKNSGLSVKGYEIHHGQSDLERLEPWLIDENGAVLGAKSRDSLTFGTYLHGLFDEDAFRRHILDNLREKKGLPRLGVSSTLSDLNPRLNALAKVFRENVDLKGIYRLLGIES
jgi:cobyric acid synthase CobQ